MALFTQAQCSPWHTVLGRPRPNWSAQPSGQGSPRCQGVATAQPGVLGVWSPLMGAAGAHGELAGASPAMKTQSQLGHIHLRTMGATLLHPTHEERARRGGPHR
jgi:hypothetical protein